MKKTLGKKTVSKSLSEDDGGLIGGIAELLEKRLWDAADQLRANSELEALNAAAQEFERRIASNVAGILEG